MYLQYTYVLLFYITQYIHYVSIYIAAPTSAVPLIMSHFTNRQGLLIRTYGAIIDNPRGSAILVHGYPSHFRSEFATYNDNWYRQFLGIHHIVPPDVIDRELKSIYNFNAESSSDEYHYSNLDGKNAFDVTPRFIYEGSFIQKLNQFGLSVYGLDLQSQGMSEGISNYRNYFLNFDDYVHDVIQFIDIVKRDKFHDVKERYKPDIMGKDIKPMKYYLMGLSMGGNIALRVPQLNNIDEKYRFPNFIDGVVCLSGMLDIESRYSDYANFISFITSEHLTYTSIANIVKDVFQIDSIHTFMRYKDPYYFIDKQSHKVIISLYDATKRLASHHTYYPRDLPTLFIHSTKDESCDIKGPRILVNEQLQDCKDIELVELDDHVHYISSAEYNERIMPTITTWLDRLIN